MNLFIFVSFIFIFVKSTYAQSLSTSHFINLPKDSYYEYVIEVINDNDSFLRYEERSFINLLGHKTQV